MVFIQLPSRIAPGRREIFGLLCQGLYDLKQSAQLWYRAAAAHLLSIGFRISPYDPALLVHDTKQGWLTLRIDDCRMTGPDQQALQWVKSEVEKRFNITNMMTGLYNCIP